MEDLVNDIMDSLILYGAISFVVFWSIFCAAMFDTAEWIIPYGVYFMGSLPLFVALDAIKHWWLLWKGVR